jgi:hypothetical protein
MAKAVTLQEWQTLCGDAGSLTLLQNHEYYADVSGAAKVVARVDIAKLTNVELFLETAKVAEKKYWRTTEQPGASATYILTRDQGQTTGFLENLLRWRVTSTGVNWQITFRVQLFLK